MLPMMSEASTHPLAMPVEAVDLFAGLLSHAEAGPTEAVLLAHGRRGLPRRRACGAR